MRGGFFTNFDALAHGASCVGAGHARAHDRLKSDLALRLLNKALFCIRTMI